MTRKETVPVTGVHGTGGMYAHVVRAGETLYLAGQVALDTEGGIVGLGDAEVQTRQALDNLSAILAQLGSDLDHLLKLTVYLTERAHLDGYRRARDSVLREPRPPTTLVFVSGLADPRYLVEVDAIALVREQAEAG
jgi:2-iminobutanoate/2-iminopropanoate deaminase